MPTATMLQSRGGDYSQIVQSVLAFAPETTATRVEALKTPAIILAEFTREIEDMDKLRGRMHTNVKSENLKQKQKMMRVKEKYDREGVNFIEDESQMGKTPTSFDQDQFDFNGARRTQTPQTQQYNMGGQGPAEGNPFKGMADTFNNMFTPK